MKALIIGLGLLSAAAQAMENIPKVYCTVTFNINGVFTEREFVSSKVTGSQIQLERAEVLLDTKKVWLDSVTSDDGGISMRLTDPTSNLVVYSDGSVANAKTLLMRVDFPFEDSVKKLFINCELL